MKKTLDEFGLRLEARSRSVVAILAGLVFAASVVGAGVLDRGSNDPVAQAPQVQGHIDGFTSLAFKLTNNAGDAKAGCALIADRERTRARGLMNVDGLAGFDAMIFRFDQNTTSAFYMANVRFPISIAWFDEDGRFVSSTNMAPCTVSAAQCPTYGAARPYRYALEVKEGDLDGIGAVEGSTLQLGNLCA